MMKNFHPYEGAVRYLKTQEEHLKPWSDKMVIDCNKMIDGLKWIARRGGYENAHWVSSAQNTKKSVNEGLRTYSLEKCWVRHV